VFLKLAGVKLCRKRWTYKKYYACIDVACKDQKQETDVSTWKTTFAISILEMLGDKGPNISKLGALITLIVSRPHPGQGSSSLSRRGASSMTISPFPEKQAQKHTNLRVGELMRRQPTSPRISSK
jgi:hypothetical protein